VRLSDAIDTYLADMQLQGRLTTAESVKKYRSNLEATVAMSEIATPRRWSRGRQRHTSPLAEPEHAGLQSLDPGQLL